MIAQVKEFQPTLQVLEAPVSPEVEDVQEQVIDDLSDLADLINQLLDAREVGSDTSKLFEKVTRHVKGVALDLGSWKDAYAKEDESLKASGLKRVLVPAEFTGNYYIA